MIRSCDNEDYYDDNDEEVRWAQWRFCLQEASITRPDQELAPGEGDQSRHHHPCQCHLHDHHHPCCRLLHDHPDVQAGEAVSLGGGSKTTPQPTFAIAQAFEPAPIFEVIFHSVILTIMVFYVIIIVATIIIIVLVLITFLTISGHQQLLCPGTHQLGSLRARNTSRGLLDR